MAAELHQCESRNITYIADDFPIFWDSAEGCRVTDVDGNVFLDMTSAFGVAAVGHCHPKVVAAVRQQAGKLLHGMGDVHPSAVKADLCRKIRDSVPIESARVILGQNGSDAVEAALKTARLASGRPGVIAFDGGYHGLSYGALNITARADFREPFQDQLGRFATLLPYGCDISVLDSILAERSSSDGGNVGAVIVEPIQGRGGIVVPPQGWFQTLHDCCRTNGVLLICDEIFTGWGRTGDWFASTFEGVVPDILCIGKAMGGGLPISACVAPASIMQAWPESRGEALHTTTFLGNPIACAAALAAIEVMEAEDLPARARAMGELLAGRLRGLQAQYPGVAREVRGRGLMLGLHIASVALADRIVRKSLQLGLIVLPAGDGSIIELIPPLTISEDQVEIAAGLLGQAIAGI
jgi:4-aminobutyrate aminotransferase-like enzyme